MFRFPFHFRHTLFAALVLAAVIFPLRLQAAPTRLAWGLPQADWRDGTARYAFTHKIDRALLERLQNGESMPALIVLAEQADVSTAKRLATKVEKGTYVLNALRAVAARTQPVLRAALDRLGLKYRAYYIVNLIAVDKLDFAAATQLAARPEVGRIVADPAVRFAEPISRRAAAAKAGNMPEWGIRKINAPELWGQNIRGQGIVVANQDTGIQWRHPALKKKYRGYDAATGKVQHSYNWWDAIHSDINGGGNPCGFSTKRPCDDDGHGTHTMGTLVGRAPDAKIGVAPKAKWIGCRNMDQGVGRPSTYLECFEFFLAPWDRQGQNPDPLKAPHIVSNSWSCPPSELCEPDTLEQATTNLRAAGIFVVVSAGNSGPTCETVSDPPAIYEAATTVGATDINDALADFSSRGPVTVDGSGRLKPDLSAPGVSVRSSLPPNSYAWFSGTSMAAPHVAGAVALLWSARPDLIGDVDATEAALLQSANPNVGAGGRCGGTDATDIPNNLFGYGRLDVLAAFNALP